MSIKPLYPPQFHPFQQFKNSHNLSGRSIVDPASFPTQSRHIITCSLSSPQSALSTSTETLNIENQNAPSEPFKELLDLNYQKLTFIKNKHDIWSQLKIFRRNPYGIKM